MLAHDLGVSRNTVTAAFEQLAAEGYVVGRIGAGSFVSQQLPEDALHARRDAAALRRQGAPAPGPSLRGATLVELSGGPSRPRTFAPGLPELAAFPFEVWARLLAKHWRRPPSSFLIGSDPLGWRPLRVAIAAYLGAARAVRCTPDQIMIVSGAQQALDLAARVLLDPGDTAWIEDPGYQGLRGALIAAGAVLAPVPVDAEGISIEAGVRRAPRARLACVSPSHQYPLGITMSLARRLELLDWARAADAFVLEDDYDSEYRYAGRPLAALQGLDADGRVIYVGTMSKVMFPGLRLGYMVVPDHLVAAFAAVRRVTDTHPPMLAQPALAEFIEAGHLTQHIRRMRSLYAQRQGQLVAACAELASGRLDVRPAEAGMHVVAGLPDGLDDRHIAAGARARGIEAPALSSFYSEAPARQGLMLGYAGVTKGEIRRGVAELAAVITAALAATPGVEAARPAARAHA